MRVSHLLLRQVRRAVIATFVLGLFGAVLQAALPLAVLHVIDSAIPSRSFETLWLIGGVAVAALATLACITAMRAKIMVRAGLWIDHTLGSHLLERGLARNASADAMAEEADALASLRTATVSGIVLPALDLPWLIFPVVALGMVDWRLALIGAAGAVGMIAHAALNISRIRTNAVGMQRAGRKATQWWLNASRTTGVQRHPANAAEHWERLNREHVAQGYALSTRLARLANGGRVVRLAAQAAVLLGGAALAITEGLSAGMLAAAVLLVWRVLEPLEQTLAALPTLVGARAGWTLLTQRAAYDEGFTPAALHAGEGLPRLHIGGPVAVGLAAVVGFFAIGLGLAATTRTGQIATWTGTQIFETRIASVFVKRKGLGADVLVEEGAIVRKGDVIATLDTKAIDARIASLKMQAATAQIELASLKQDLVTLTGPGAAPIRNRAPLEKLEARIADLGRQSRDLIVAIAAAEDEVAQSRVIAPEDGRIMRVAMRAGMPVEPDAAVATLVTADDSLLGRLIAPLVGKDLSQKLSQLLGGAIAADVRQDRNG